jgi:RIO-like serine/threonine protein kinase
MKLIRENKEKQRSVFFNEDRYVKVWGSRPTIWITEHVKLLHVHVPGFVLAHGNDWISYKIIPGVPASEFPHTPAFVKRIHEFCIKQIDETRPWFHGDWSLSNMIIDGDNITMIDWDNLGQYSEEAIQTKLNFDLKSAFGKLYVL